MKRTRERLETNFGPQFVEVGGHQVHEAPSEAVQGKVPTAKAAKMGRGQTYEAP